MAALCSFGTTGYTLAYDYKARQIPKNAPCLVPPLGVVPSKITNGIFVRLTSPMSLGGECDSFYPSVHGEPISRNQYTEDRYGVVVSPGYLDDRVEIDTSPYGQFELINTGCDPLCTNDVFVVRAPNANDQNAQKKCLTQNPRAEASLCSDPATTLSMQQLLGGLYATAKIDGSLQTELRERFKRDLDIALAYDPNNADLPMDDIPMRTLQTAMNFAANAQAIVESFNNQPNLIGVVDRHLGFLRNENQQPATLAEMHDLFQDEALRNAFAVAGQDSLCMHSYLSSDTKGYVLQSTLANPTPISSKIPVYSPRQGTTLTGGRFYGCMMQFNWK